MVESEKDVQVKPKRREAQPRDDLFRILNHPARRMIIVLLHERIELTYSELLKELGIEEGLFNFHLRNMKHLVETTEDGAYILSKSGHLAYELVEKASSEIPGGDSLMVAPAIDLGIAGRRIAAFLVDVAVFLFVTGAFLDSNIWHLAQLHLSDIAEHASEIITTYSHIFFAVFITFTLLEAYKGQTLGKYIAGIRVVTTSNRRLSLMESGIRNIGKVFLLPIDLPIGIFYYKKGYMRFFDFYVRCKTERTKEVAPSETRTGISTAVMDESSALGKLEDN